MKTNQKRKNGNSQDQKEILAITVRNVSSVKRRKFHEASTFRIDRRVRECAGLLKDDKLLAKLSVDDMVALEVKYHQTCLVRFYNKARKLKREENKESSNNSSDSIDQGVALAELIICLFI